MDPNSGQQQPTGGNVPDGSLQIVGQRRGQSVAPQGAARQLAASGGRRARSARADQPSPNARGGAAQRTHDGSVAFAGGAMAMEQFAPAQAQAQQQGIRQRMWHAGGGNRHVRQAVRMAPGPYAYAASEQPSSLSHEYALSNQVRLAIGATCAAGSQGMTCTWPAFRLAVGMIA